MNAFRKWLRSAAGYIALTALSASMVVLVDPPMRPVFTWLAWTVWLIPLLSAGSRGRCRTPRWFGRR